MTLPRHTRDVRQLALALCLGIPLLVLLLAIGLMVLLHTFEEPHPDTFEPPESFVCMSDVGGTLLLCEWNYSAQPSKEIVLSSVGSMTS